MLKQIEIKEGHRQDSLGVIAGAGRFPFLVLEGARAAGLRVTVVGLRGLADPQLRTMADRHRWSGVARLGAWIRFFKGQGIRRAVLAGSVRKTEMYGRFRLLTYLPDLTSLRLWFLGVRDKRNDTILVAVADELARHGIVLESCVKYCPQALAPEGVMTRHQPDSGQKRDIEFGWSIAKEMGRLDIGQSVAVKETEVIAVEAIEGTDRMIERAGELCPRGGWMLIKVAKPDQDMRFDVPTVGPDTVENLNRFGGRALVIEAHKTVVVDADEMIRRADKYGMVVVGHAP